MPEPRAEAGVKAGAGARVTSRRFFSVPADTLAPRLIGTRLVRVLDDGTRLSGLIVETEAYLGVTDRAAHSFGGRRTARNEAMYHHPGTSYVYFTYGMHFCVNVVCGRVGEPTAVLLRALAPSEGVDRMAALRGLDAADPRAAAGLCRGPGNLCRAMAIDRSLNFVDLTVHPSLWIERTAVRGWAAGASLPGELRGVSVMTGPRIGISSAGEPWVSAPLRWFVAGHPCVSGPRAVRGARQTGQAGRRTKAAREPAKGLRRPEASG